MNPGRAIPKALKMVPMATLLGAQYYKASTGFSSPNNYRTTNFATLAKINKSEKSLIIINVCIHRRTIWKTGSYAKYVILLKYRDYYYYYYYYQQMLSSFQLLIRFLGLELNRNKAELELLIRCHINPRRQ